MLVVLLLLACWVVQLGVVATVVHLPYSTYVPPTVHSTSHCWVGGLLSVCELKYCAADTSVIVQRGAIYKYTAPYPGIYHFTTENANTDCGNTYLSVAVNGTQVCNDDISSTNKRSALFTYLARNATATILVAEASSDCTLRLNYEVSIEITLTTTLLPTMSPTNSPSKAPTTSLPTQSPSKAPTTSLPTHTPSQAPTTSLPTHSPSKAPTTSQPTHSPSKTPTTSQPTLMPTTSQPTSAPTTSIPTQTPTTSIPTQVPTTSPTFQCRPGTFSETGYDTQLGTCKLCPAGEYDLPTTYLRTDCLNRLPCGTEHWCGDGAVLDYNYVRVISHMDVDSTLVVASTRMFTVNFDKLTPQAVEMHYVASDIPVGIKMLNNVSASAEDTAFQVSFLADADALENLSGQADNEFTATITLYGRYAYEQQSEITFTSQLKIRILMVSVVINPSAFDYSLLIGSVYSTALSPLPVSEVLNPLCTDTLFYTASVCNSSEHVLKIDNTTILQAELPPGQSFGNSFAFHIDLTGVQSPVDFTQHASVLHTCVSFDMRLMPLDISFVKTIEVTVQLLDLCPPGTSSLSGTNDLGCTACPTGTYQPNFGSQICFPVSAGFESNANRTGFVGCPKGYMSNSASQLCVPCPFGTYADTTESTFCKPCPSSTFPTTLFEGSTSLDECTTDELQNAFKNSQGTLQACPIGVTCDFDGAMVATFKVNRGYYRTSNTSLDIRACREKYCEPEEQRQRRLLYSSQYDTKYCTQHHQGHLCETCEDGYVRRGDYRLCAFCDRDTTKADYLRIVGIFIGLVIGAVLASATAVTGAYLQYKPKPYVQEYDEQNVVPASKQHSRCNAISKQIVHMIGRVDFSSPPIKITIGYFQVVAGMAYALAEYLPEYFRQLADFFSLLSLDFIQVFDFGCSLRDQGHFTSLLFSTLVPFALFIILVAAERVLTPRVEHRESLHIGFMNLYIWILFLIYPSVAKTIFQSFPCESFDDGMAFVRTDLTMDCTSVEYQGMVAYAVLAIFTYVVGVPAFFYVILDRQRFLLNAAPDFEPRISLAYREKNLSVQSTRMLWSGYSPSQYNFEVFELVRKLFQTSVFVFVSTDSAGQAISLLVVCAVVIVIIGRADPYVKQVHNGLAQWAQWNIFAIAFVALLNRMEATSTEEKDALYVLLIICLVSVPMFALWIALRAVKSSTLATRALASVLDAADSPFAAAATPIKRQLERLATQRGIIRSMSSNSTASTNNNSGIVELQRLVYTLDKSPLRDRMLTLLDLLDKTVREEKQVAAMERKMLKDHEMEKAQLRRKIAELAEENDTLVFSTMSAEEALSVQQREHATKLAELRVRVNNDKTVFQQEHPPQSPTKRSDVRESRFRIPLNKSPAKPHHKVEDL